MIFPLCLQKGASALEIAASKGFPQVTELLLKGGADVNAINPVCHHHRLWLFLKRNVLTLYVHRSSWSHPFTPLARMGLPMLLACCWSTIPTLRPETRYIAHLFLLSYHKPSSYGFISLWRPSLETGHTPTFRLISPKPRAYSSPFGSRGGPQCIESCMCSAKGHHALLAFFWCSLIFMFLCTPLRPRNMEQPYIQPPFTDIMIASFYFSNMALIRTLWIRFLIVSLNTMLFFLILNSIVINYCSLFLWCHHSSHLLCPRTGIHHSLRLAPKVISLLLRYCWMPGWMWITKIL